VSFLSRRDLLLISGVLPGTLCLSQESAPWRQSELIEPSALATALDSKNPPIIICVAFPVLYHAKHIRGAIFAGPGSRPEGAGALKAAVSALKKDENLVIYCGCCPMEKCPNVRPAYAALKESGFTRVRVLDIPTNMAVDWYSRGYPTDTGDKRAE
jgi:thiosulfate/3-mercaptopyruvate sulfurtransferase